MMRINDNGVDRDMTEEEEEQHKTSIDQASLLTYDTLGTCLKGTKNPT